MAAFFTTEATTVVPPEKLTYASLKTAALTTLTDGDLMKLKEKGVLYGIGIRGEGFVYVPAHFMSWELVTKETVGIRYTWPFQMSPAAVATLQKMHAADQSAEGNPALTAFFGGA